MTQTTNVPADSVDGELREKIYELAAFIVDYEFQAPSARYSNRRELIDKYSSMLNGFIARHTQQAVEAAQKKLIQEIERLKKELRNAS